MDTNWLENFFAKIQRHHEYIVIVIDNVGNNFIRERGT